MKIRMKYIAYQRKAISYSPYKESIIRDIIKSLRNECRKSQEKRS